MVDSSPEIVGLAIDLHEDLIEMPLPLGDLSHVAGSTHPDLAREHGPETINPEPYAFVANIDSALMQKIFDIPKRERETHIHHHRKLDDLGRCFEISERISGHPETLTDLPYPLNRSVALTMPSESRAGSDRMSASQVLSNDLDH